MKTRWSWIPGPDGFGGWDDGARSHGLGPSGTPLDPLFGGCCIQWGSPLFFSTVVSWAFLQWWELMSPFQGRMRPRMLSPGQGWFARRALRKAFCLSEGNFGVRHRQLPSLQGSIQPLTEISAFCLDWGRPAAPPASSAAWGQDQIPGTSPPLRWDLVRPRMYLCLQSFCITDCISFQNQYSRTFPTLCAVVIAVLGGGGRRFAAPPAWCSLLAWGGDLF